MKPIVVRVRSNIDNVRGPLVKEINHSAISPIKETIVKSKAAPFYIKSVKKADLSNLSIGSIVYHKTFGQGTVKVIDKVSGFITVSFEGKDRNFQFPDAFEQGFLT
jgi:transcription elongation factor GreA-like protein